MFILILLDLDKKKIIDLILILLDLDKKNQKKKWLFGLHSCYILLYHQSWIPSSIMDPYQFAYQAVENAINLAVYSATFGVN